jgi:hypothetical protein
MKTDEIFSAKYLLECYMCLKQEIYHENLNFFLKETLSEFEGKHQDINTYFSDLASDLSIAFKTNNMTKLVSRFLIDFIALPKSINGELYPEKWTRETADK